MSEERKRWLGWLLAGLIIIALAGGFAFYRPFESSAETVAPLEPAPPPPSLNTLPERQTFLVMGVDPDGEFGRADSMMVVSYDAKEQRLAMLSIPRDTWTLIPGHGYDKINHAYAYGGHKLAIDTVERLLGIDINHWVTLSFEGFTEVVDAVGGVEINVPKRLYYDDPYDERMGEGGLVIDIQPGQQRMDGITALKYARFRADEEGDVGRMRRQQEVIQAVIRKAASPAMIARIPQLIPAMASTVGTDLSVAEMLKLAATGRDSLSRPLDSGALTGEPMMLEGVFYFATDIVAARTTAYEVLVGSKPDEEFLKLASQDQKLYQTELEEALARSRAAAAETEEPEKAAAAEPGAQAPAEPAETPAAPKPAQKLEAITVAVVDATGQGIAKEYVRELRAAGFRVARVTRSPKVLKSTVVINHADQPGVEERLKAVLPTMLWASAPDPRAEQALEIILGTDLLEEKKP